MSGRSNPIITPLIETDLSGNNQSVYLFFNGERTGRHLWINEIDFYVYDHLGNTRYLHTLAGSNQSDFYPFGGDAPSAPPSPTNGNSPAKNATPNPAWIISGQDTWGAISVG